MEELVVRYGRALLRDMRPEDAARHVRWLTEETAWLDWDAPWELVPATADLLGKFAAQARRPPASPRTRMELCTADGIHVGRVNAYRIPDDPERLAAGIGVRESAHWGKGVGTDGFVAWISRLFETTGRSEVFCETWSGNHRMLRLAAKCGFSEVLRRPAARLVRGERYDALRLALGREAFDRRWSGARIEVSRNLPRGSRKG